VERLAEILSNWDVGPLKPANDGNLRGSPRRSLERYLLEGDGLFVLERISPAKAGRKEEQAKILSDLYDRKVPAERYLVSGSGEYVVKAHGFWMLKKYIAGEDLKRPDFINDSWRGEEAAKFLGKLRSASDELNIRMDAAHLPSFIDGFMRRLERKDAEIHSALSGPYSSVKPLLKKWDSLSHSFTHGDFHPMNIIWGNERINAVIDWEFMGLRPEMYDVAMMLGCLGIEDPDGLFSPFAEEFLKGLKKAGFDAISWEYLPEMILATRFAWMDEWMKNRDRKMIRSELEYISAISENMRDIRDYFNGF